MKPRKTFAETSAEVLARGHCPKHPARDLAPGRKTCHECYDLSKADAYDEAHGDPQDEEV